MVSLFRNAGSSCTSAFVLIGKDVDVKLTHIMRAQLDQHIDKAERDVIEDIKSDPLNPQEITPSGTPLFFELT